MTSPPSDTGSHSIYDHKLRKEWGVGILAWEDGGKRGYLFEDGEERTMASGFHQMMRRVEQPTAEQVAAVERMRRKLAAREHARSSTINGPKVLDQLTRLHETFEAGLLDAKWATEVRGEGAEQRLPGHRAAMILEAQQQLSASALDALLSSHSYGALWEQVLTVLSHTDLVPTAQLVKPKRADNEQQRALAVAVRDLLHGPAAYEQRFDRFVAVLATLEPPRWEMATALSALVHPAQHVCVHPAAFRLQLKATGSRGTAPTRPSGAAYTRMLAVARFVSTKLTEQNQPPRDLLDVYDFIRVTLAPAPKPTKASTRRALL